MDRSIEQRTMRKVYLRLLPFAMIVYFFCYLDRINVGFAALTMNKAIGLTAAAYGVSAGAFYLGYCLFEVPSNIVLDKVGARLWIARIMVTWGIASGATAFIVGPNSFLLVRFLLGMSEAGLFPGIVLLFTYWFPDHHRARIVSSFTLALPVSVALGAPISTAVLGMDGLLGIAGWKWIYLLEAAPTILLGIGVLFYLTDKPEQARWLTPEERAWLTGRLAAEKRAVESVRTYSFMQALFNPKVLLLCLNYLGIVTASLGIVLFVPQIIKSLGATNMGTGYATMLAYICGAISMVTWGWVSDRMGERRWNLFWACMVATVGLVIAGIDHGHLVGAGRAVHLHGRLLRHQGAVLVDAVDDADRDRGGGRHRLDQLDRQCRQVFRPRDRRLAEGRHRQLCGRPVRAGAVHADVGDHRRVRAAHPAPGCPRGPATGRSRVTRLAPYRALV